MRNLQKFALVFLTVLFNSLPAMAQSPITPPPNNNTLDNLPNQPDQLLSWVCTQGKKQIAAEVKNVSNWPQTIVQQGWKCQQNVIDTTTGSLKFSCTGSGSVVSIVTVTWIKGNDEQQLMGNWMHQLANNQDMVCRISKVQLWGTIDDLTP